MKILLFGSAGQVGWELQRSLAPLGELIALDRRSAGLCGDLTDLDGIAEAVSTVGPQVIVNAAAYTAVDKAEVEPELARTINATAPGILARAARQCGATLVHYSTDYVFDGSGDRPWMETDCTAPLNVYGQTKLEGEEAIRSSACQHLVFRTSWVYGTRGGNFAKTMLRFAQQRESFKVVDDQIGAPTGADLLADVTAHCLRYVARRPELGGLYHVAGTGRTTWHGYARHVVEFAARAGLPLRTLPHAVLPVPSTEYPTPAVRPKNSRLDTRKLQRTFDLTLPSWESGVTRMLTETVEGQR